MTGEWLEVLMNWIVLFTIAIIFIGMVSWRSAYDERKRNLFTGKDR
jgi:hypothetical protein